MTLGTCPRIEHYLRYGFDEKTSQKMMAEVFQDDYANTKATLKDYFGFPARVSLEYFA